MIPLKLLVVEGEPASLELITEVFTSLEAEVRPVSDSRKAADIVGLEKFEGIFLDVEMPNMNGFDLARIVRKSSWNKSTSSFLPEAMADLFGSGRFANGALLL